MGSTKVIWYSSVLNGMCLEAYEKEAESKRVNAFGLRFLYRKLFKLFGIEIKIVCFVFLAFRNF